MPCLHPVLRHSLVHCVRLQDYSEVFKDNKFDLAIDCLPGEHMHCMPSMP